MDWLVESQPVIRTHIPEGLTIIFEQKQRKGKTLGGVMWALDAFQHGRNVFSSIKLGFPHQPLQFEEMQLEDGSSKFWNGHIFIDELNFFFRARRSMDERNLKAADFLLQQKKQGCNVTGTTHDILDVDVILREHYDFLIVPEVFPAYPEPPVIISLEIHTGPLQTWRPPRTITLDCRPYLGLYDSFKIYNPFKVKPVEERSRRANVGRRVTL